MVWRNVEQFCLHRPDRIMKLQSLADRPPPQKAIAPTNSPKTIVQHTCVKPIFAIVLINTGF